MELIDRKELLKAIERDSEGIKGQYGDEWLFLKTIESIPICAIPAIPLQKCTDVVDLPSGVYRPTGEWIDHSEDGYAECPFCHEATNCDGNIGELHYCWNCGARLGANVRGEE